MAANAGLASLEETSSGDKSDPATEAEDQAFIAYNRGIEFYNLGMAAYISGQSDKAVTHLERLLSPWPGSMSFARESAAIIPLFLSVSDGMTALRE